MIARLLTFPLILILAGIAALMMYLPAIDAGMRGFSGVGKAFAFSGTIGFALVITIGLALSGRSDQRMSDTQNLMSLLLAYVLLPVFLAIPFYSGVRNTTFLNAYFEMVSSFTTTGATLFGTPGRLVDSLHLWRALVGWGGGLLLWISASAVLAPLNLGGFEVTARGEPGQDET
ncbi:MAG: TrkH family potassium uptake protein, partial [Roseovarius sp.]|nr:TrkH family potassium uptake protein [Roseovarius sp.]